MFFRIRNLEDDVARLERKIERYKDIWEELIKEVDLLKHPEKAEANRIQRLEYIIEHGVLNRANVWGMIGTYTNEQRSNYATEVAEYYLRKAKELKPGEGEGE